MSTKTCFICLTDKDTVQSCPTCKAHAHSKCWREFLRANGHDKRVKVIRWFGENSVEISDKLSKIVTICCPCCRQMATGYMSGYRQTRLQFAYITQSLMNIKLQEFLMFLEDSLKEPNFTDIKEKALKLADEIKTLQQSVRRYFSRGPIYDIENKHDILYFITEFPRNKDMLEVYSAIEGI